MLRYLIIFMFTFGVAMTLEGSSAVREVSTQERLSQLMSRADSDTLVVFDVDQTLLIPANPAFQGQHIQQYRKDFVDIWGKMTSEERDLFATLAVMGGAGSQLAEERMPEMVASLQQQGAKVVALTALLTGPAGGIADLAEKRSAELEALGFHFADSFPKLTDKMVFGGLGLYRGQQVQYCRGVLYANGEQAAPTKGDVLIAFLDRLQWQPKEIIFVDDRRRNLQNVAEVIEAYAPKIHVTGLHYTAVYNAEPTAALEREKVIAQWQRLAGVVRRLG